MCIRDRARPHDFEEFLPSSRALIYKEIETFFETKWKQRWKSNKLGQINYWFKDINIQKSKIIMKLPRDKLSVLVRFITGHCHLKRQNVLTNKLDAYDINCRLCGMDRERAIHILTQCEPLCGNIELQHLGNHIWTLNLRIGLFRKCVLSSL